MNAADLLPGQVIELNDGRIAVVRHVGPVHFQPGEWVGIELEESTGKNDGSVQGQRYFDCEQGHGMFLRSAGVRQVLEQPEQQQPKAPQPQPQPKPKPTGTGTGGAAGIGRPRPSSIHAGANGVKKQDVAPGRRASAIMETASPTPGARSGLSGLRSPVKSPTKQLGGNGIPSTSTSRTSTPPTNVRRPPGTTGPAPTARTRPSVGPQSTATSKRTSMAPPAAVAGTPRTSRPSAAAPSSARAPAARAPPGRPAAAARPTPSSRAVPGRRDSEKLQHHAESNNSPQPDLLSPRESDVSSAVSQAETDQEAIQDDEEDPVKPNFAPPPPPPVPADNAPKTTSSRRTSSPPASLHSQRTVRSSAQSARQIEELEAKIRQLERKRQEDRELKKSLDKVQEDRDRYQGIIEKLQKKYQPQQ